MDRLKEPFTDSDDSIDDITWDSFEDIYYQIIDNDETLKVRSEKIRFNGTLWSSAADIRAIAALSFIATIVIGLISYLKFYTGISTKELCKSSIVFILCFYGSIPISSRLTKRHQDMIKRQCSYILLHKRKDLAEGFKIIANK